MLSSFSQKILIEETQLKAPFCNFSAGLSSNTKSAVFFLFSFYLNLALSSLQSFLLPQSLADLAGTVFFFLFYYQTRGGRDATERRSGIREDERQPKMERLAAR